jgi:outer membrane biosynthesis protein TonB
VRASIVATISLFAFASALSAQEPFTPAQLQVGNVPQLPPLTVGGGEVLLEVTVGVNGDVTDVRPVRATPPFTDMLTQSVRAWRFSPAQDAARPVESRVLVAGLFRPPALTGPTLGTPPKEVTAPSNDVAVPLRMVTPDFPVEALRGGVVLLEAHVDGTGAVGDIGLLVSAEPFDEYAGEALSDWTFRPARIRGANASTLVYVVMGFPAPASLGAAQE